MHPAIVLPAIEGALAATVSAASTYERAKRKLRRGLVLVNFDPHGNAPRSEVLPPHAGDWPFWEIADDQTYGAFVGQLAIHLDMLGLPARSYSALPPGYGVARYAARFEIHCKFSAWLAIENVGADDMVLVRKYYRRIGLDAEASALEKAEAAWYAAGGHGEGGYDAASAAYETVPNPHSDEDARWRHILGLLRSSAFWLSAEGGG